MLDISESILKEHLISEDYDRPRIEMSNYYLKWNDESYGISQKETPELKRFLANVIPFFDTSYELLNTLEKPKHKRKYRLFRELCPQIRISHRNRDHHTVSYELHMHPDGSTFIDRIEGMETIKNNKDIIKKANIQRENDKPILYFKWNLGELLFNRQGGI